MYQATIVRKDDSSLVGEFKSPVPAVLYTATRGVAGDADDALFDAACDVAVAGIRPGRLISVESEYYAIYFEKL